MTYDAEKVVRCYREYMRRSVDVPPSKKEFLQNVELKIRDDEFLGDTHLLLRPDEPYDPAAAWEAVRTVIEEQL